MRFHPRLPHGYAKARLRSARRRLDMRGQVEIHHVVPREFKHHPRVRLEKYNVEAGYNTILLPSSAFRGPCVRPVHTGGHPGYNAWVRHHLDACDGTAAFLALVALCHLVSRGRRRDVPWKKTLKP